MIRLSFLSAGAAICLLACSRPVDQETRQRAQTDYDARRFTEIIRRHGQVELTELRDNELAFLLGKAYFFQAREKPAYVDPARRIFVRLTNLRPDFSEPYLYLARLDYFYRLEEEPALRTLDALLAIYPDDFRARALRFQIRRSQGRSAEAAREARYLLLYGEDLRAAAAYLKQTAQQTTP